MRNYFALVLFFLGLTAASLTLNISNIPESYIADDLPSHVVHRDIKNNFHTGDNLIFVFQGKEKFDLKTLKKLKDFVVAVEKIEGTQKVRSIFSHEFITGYEDGFSVEKVFRSFINEEERKKALALFEKDPFINDLLVSKDGTKFSVIIEPDDLTDSLVRYKYENEILGKIESVGLEDNKIAYGGNFALDMFQFRELLNMVGFAIPCIFTIGLIIIFALFKSKILLIWGAIFNLLASNFAFLIFAVFRFDINLVSSIIPALNLAVSIAFLVHLYNSLLLLSTDGKDNYISRAIKEIDRSCFYSALTTSIGLLSLSISDIPPLYTLGTVSGISVMVIYILVLKVLPKFLERFETQIRIDLSKIQEKKRVGKISSRISEIVFTYPGRIILATLVLCLACIPFVTKVKSESSMYEFFSKDHPINVSNNEIRETFSGTTMVSVLFEGGGYLSSDFLSRLEKATIEIESRKNVDRAFSANKIIKQINRSFQGGGEDAFVIPTDDALIEQYLFVYDGTDLYDFLSRDHNNLLMRINLSVDKANESEIEINTIRESMNKYFPEGGWRIGGYGVMFSDQENLIVGDLFKSTLICFGLIWLLMLLLWRSFSISVIGMLPNLSPVLIMFALMGIFTIWLDIGTAMIASVTMGIAVDDTIHMLHGIWSRKNQMGFEHAIKTTLNETGSAIFMTTLILFSQFFVLSFSSFYPVKFFGALTSAGLVAAMIFDLFFVPSLILFAKRKGLL